MGKADILEQLWCAPIVPGTPFHLEQTSPLPPAARRYLEHTIAPGTPKMSTVRLRMHGAIRLKEVWHPFDADEVINWNQGFVWRAKAKLKGLPVTGFDCWINGKGAMRWRLLGILPAVTASGPDMDRSAVERMMIEAVWIPSVLLDPNVTWGGRDATHMTTDLRLKGHRTHLEWSLSEEGRVISISMLRWGNPEGHGYRTIPFGGIAEKESTFGGFTIPSKLRIGWYFGTDLFEPEGEFFRCAIDEATYR